MNQSKLKAIECATLNQRLWRPVEIKQALSAARQTSQQRLSAWKLAERTSEYAGFRNLEMPPHGRSSATRSGSARSYWRELLLLVALALVQELEENLEQELLLEDFLGLPPIVSIGCPEHLD